ncbi:hypothetical protein D4R87_01300 [bacterium]|nr:MAG: hypothetical protein D4R87_01300 [bacterium]
MGSLITYLENNFSLLYKWQNFFGSIIGVIGAFLVALFSFLFNHFYQKHREKREGTRQTEIALALGLNDIYDTEKHLSDFLVRLERIIRSLQEKTFPKQYCLNRTNFPPLYIHIDSSLLKANHSSYYVHNKILIIYKNIEQANRVFSEMKADYGTIFETAKYLIDRKVSIDNQQGEYLMNNQSFKDFVNSAIDQLQIIKKIFTQTKVYNLKLLNKQWFRFWKLESVSFKFFCCKQDIEKYRNTFYCLDRIDKEIDAEVTSFIKEIQEEQDNNYDQGEPWKFFRKYIKLVYRWLIRKFRH